MRLGLRLVRSSELKSDSSFGRTSSGSRVGVGFCSGVGDSLGEVIRGEADVTEGVEVGFGGGVEAEFELVIPPES